MNTENINIEDIKVGETYNVRVKIHRMTPAGLVCYATDKDGHYLSEHPNFFTESEVEAFSPVIPAPKHSEPAPKYDPCRLFKKGDKVRVVECNGRDYKDYDPYSNIQKSELYTVLENESEIIDGGCGDIIIGKDNIEHETLFCFLELITPVEELEPYCVKQGCEQESMVDTFPYWSVVSSGCEVARFYSEQYEDGKAKEAAEAECARLNAEYRKEVEK